MTDINRSQAQTTGPDLVEVMRKATEAAYKDLFCKLQALAALRGGYLPSVILDASCDIEEYLEPNGVIDRTNRKVMK